MDFVDKMVVLMKKSEYKYKHSSSLILPQLVSLNHLVFLYKKNSMKFGKSKKNKKHEKRNTNEQSAGPSFLYKNVNEIGQENYNKETFTPIINSLV